MHNNGTITKNNLINNLKNSKPSVYVSFMNGKSNSTSCTPSNVQGSSLRTWDYGRTPHTHTTKNT